MSDLKKKTAAQCLCKAIKSLNGVAAVNLTEPSEGDLTRITDTYRKLRFENERYKEILTNKVLKHKEAYHTDIFPDYSLKAGDKPSIDQVSGKMGRHMCDMFLTYMTEAEKESREEYED